ncbi:MAG: hypothetical protein V1835_06065 [Candidatus Micrarchaeota archaeon]
MIEDELIHWFKDEKGESHKSTLRLETDPPTVQNTYPRDGVITLRMMNGIGTIGFKMSPDEALRLGTHLLNLAKEELAMKRKLWNNRE